MDLFGARSVHPVGVRIGGFHGAPPLAQIDAMRDKLRAALPEAEALIRWAAAIPMPPDDQDFISVGMRRPDLYAIETTGAGPITSADAAGRTRLLGYPTREVETMPVSPGTASTPVFAYGDLRKGWILGDRHAAEVETSEHYAFNTDQLTLRFKARVGFLPAQPTALVVYVTAS